ncbi:MAG TPA: hypothetical protein VJB89_04255 [Candidatus Nanoarchaeia archaeon]|nr:hypothetical protein [Candidatus Nanoarchaeia archaeon]
MENETEYLKDKNSNKDLRKEKNMGLFGNGQGYFGIAIRYNHWIRVLIITLIFGTLGIYLFNNDQQWEGFISFGTGLMFLLFNNIMSD